MGQKDVAMNTFSAFLSVAALALVSTLPACAGPAEEQSSDTAALEATLKAQSIVKASIQKGQTVKISYDPESYDKNDYAPTAGLPFMAVRVLPSATPAIGSVRTQSNGKQTLNVSVKGDFPGSPRLVVVDDNFHVLAATNGTSVGGSDVATIELPDLTSGFTVLVRDEIWVRPMEFEVGATLEQ